MTSKIGKSLISVSAYSNSPFIATLMAVEPFLGSRAQRAFVGTSTSIYLLLAGFAYLYPT
jgi:hypothetical protein